MKNCITELAKFSLPLFLRHPRQFDILFPELIADLEIPLCSSSISAGFPSPAENYIEDIISLKELLIKNNSATYFLRVRGDSMRDANISEDDILIVDRSLEPAVNQIIIGFLDNEFTVKRLVKKQDQYYLQPENPAYPVIPLSQATDFKIWGVVTWCIHKICRS